LSKYIEQTIASTLQSYIGRQNEQHRKMAIAGLAWCTGILEEIVLKGRSNASMEVVKNLQSMVLSHTPSPEHKAELEKLMTSGREWYLNHTQQSLW
jgi:hypothetical protein